VADYRLAHTCVGPSEAEAEDGYNGSTDADAVGRDPYGVDGRGFHSLTSHLKLSHFGVTDSLHSTHCIPRKVLTSSRKVDECKGLPFVYFLPQPVLFLSVLLRCNDGRAVQGGAEKVRKGPKTNNIQKGASLDLKCGSAYAPDGWRGEDREEARVLLVLYVPWFSDCAHLHGCQRAVHQRRGLSRCPLTRGGVLRPDTGMIET